MTTFLPSARPPWAITCWCDDNDIFVELPCKDAPPYITKYPLTEGGLSKALYILREAHHKAKPSRRVMSDTKTDWHPKLSKVVAQSEFTEEQRAKARDVLRRMKITGA